MIGNRGSWFCLKRDRVEKSKEFRVHIVRISEFNYFDNLIQLGVRQLCYTPSEG